MSRYIEVHTGLGLVKETITSMDECRRLVNEVCCNELSDACGGLVDSRFCNNKCEHFEKEDGIIIE